MIGFSTHQSTITAAHDWNEPPLSFIVQPGMASSYEALFHDLSSKQFILHLHNNPELEHLLQLSRLQRAIGVVYRLETERDNHYFFTRLPYQFDSIIHIDETRAVQPIKYSTLRNQKPAVSSLKESPTR